MIFRLATLGCKVNQYETEFVREGLLRLGYVEASKDDITDLVIVNTCTVTAESDQKSRKLVRKLARENEGAKIVVMGCSVTSDPGAFTGIDRVSNAITDKRELPAFLADLGLTAIPTGIESFGRRHRAYVKVQDGCRVGCSYCIIPTVRPNLLSRPEDDVLEEIRQLARKGYGEIVLTGIHLGHYGIDQEPARGGNRPTLASLVRRIVEEKEPPRLRISSLEAVEVTDELVDLMVEHPEKICPHLHLSMQSGSNAVLRRMRRRWLREPFIRRCREILERFDRAALTTDVIVGFPGETEEQFEETCQAVEELRFSKVHVFRFSPRKGTEAATLPDRIAPTEQKRRAEKISRLAEGIRADYARSLCGMTLSVLLETRKGGTSDRYLDVRLDKPVPESEVGRIVNVLIEESKNDLLIGKIIPEPGRAERFA